MSKIPNFSSPSRQHSYIPNLSPGKIIVKKKRKQLPWPSVEKYLSKKTIQFMLNAKKIFLFFIQFKINANENDNLHSMLENGVI